MAELSSETIQAACVAVLGRAVLIEGHSPESRAELALRLIDRGATLVAGGPTVCRRRGEALLASAAPDASGRIEVRGLGIVELASAEDVPVELIAVILDAAPRFPEDRRSRRIAGIEVPVLPVTVAEPAAPIKIELALGKFPG